MFGSQWLSALLFKLGDGGGLGRSHSRRVRRRVRPCGLAISHVESLEIRALLGSLISQPAILGALLSDSYTAASVSPFTDMSSGGVSSGSLSGAGVPPSGGPLSHVWDTLSATARGAENKASGSSSATAPNSSTDSGHAPQLVRSDLPAGLTNNLSDTVFGNSLFNAFDDPSTSGTSGVNLDCVRCPARQPTIPPPATGPDRAESTARAMAAAVPAPLRPCRLAI